jgi:hypothetical protein
VLVAPPPCRPSQPGPGILRWLDEQGSEQSGDFVAGEQALPGWCPVAGVLGGGGDGEKRGGEHRQGGPPVPGGQAADLVVIEPVQALAGLEVSSVIHRLPMILTRAGRGTWPGQ